MIDTSKAFGARAERRLRTERLIWLTTVRADGTPQPIPVWFLWNRESFLIYSRPNQQKLRNLEANPRVALHFDGDGQGGDIVVIAGEARIAADEPPADRVHEYVEKYTWGFERIGLSAAEFARAYSVPIRVKAVGLRGH